MRCVSAWARCPLQPCASTACAGAGGGSIVWQGSISSFLSQPDCATYAAMKAAVVQMARNAAHDFAKYGIRSNSVCAGTVETPISAVERKEHGWTFEEWQALKTKDVILGRGAWQGLGA